MKKSTIYFINNNQSICQTYSGELTQESSERIVENAETVNVKWALSESTTSCCAENVSGNMLKS